MKSFDLKDSTIHPASRSKWPIRKRAAFSWTSTLIVFGCLCPDKKNIFLEHVVPFFFNPLFFLLWKSLAPTGAALSGFWLILITVEKATGMARPFLPRRIKPENKLRNGADKTVGDPPLAGAAFDLSAPTHLPPELKPQPNQETRKNRFRIPVSKRPLQTLFFLVLLPVFILRPNHIFLCFVASALCYWVALKSKVRFGPLKKLVAISGGLEAAGRVLLAGLIRLSILGSLYYLYHLFQGLFFLLFFGVLFIYFVVAPGCASFLREVAFPGFFNKPRRFHKTNVSIERPRLAFRLETWLFRQFCWPLFLGVLMGGIAFDPDFFSRAAGLSLTFAGLLRFSIRFLPGRSTLRRRIDNDPVLWLASGAVAASVADDLNNAAPASQWILFFLGGIALIYLLFSEDPTSKKLDFQATRHLCFLSLPAAIVIFLHFVEGEPGTIAIHPLPIEGLSQIYDVKHHAPTDSLLFSSKNPPYVARYDLNSGKLTEIGVRLYHPERIEFSNALDKAYISGRHGVQELDVPTMNPTRHWNTKANVDIQVDPGGRLFVASELNREIRSISLKTGKIHSIDVRAIHSWHYGLLYDARRDALLISHWNTSPYISRVSLKRSAVRTTYSGPMNMDMCLTDQGSRVIVARPLNRRADVRDAVTLKKISEVPLPFGVREIACDDKGGRLFAAAEFQGFVDAMDLRTGRRIARFKTGTEIRGIDYDPESQTIYLAAKDGIYRQRLTEKFQNLRR